MEGEDNGFVGGEDGVELALRQAMGVLVRRLNFHKIDDINDTHLQVRDVFAQEVGRREESCP